TLPGLAYLYKGLTTPQIWVADRAAGAHRSVNTYDTVAASLILQPLAAAGVSPRINTQPGYMDTRLLRAKNVFVLPLSNYNEKIGSDVIVKITPPADAGKPVRATSAFGGKIDVHADAGVWTITVPKLGFGDVVRIECE